MYTLTVLCKYDPLTGWPDQEIHLSTEYEDVDKAALRAMLWLSYRPNDIIMLLEEVTV